MHRNTTIQKRDFFSTYSHSFICLFSSFISFFSCVRVVVIVVVLFMYRVTSKDDDDETPLSQHRRHFCTHTRDPLDRTRSQVYIITIIQIIYIYKHLFVENLTYLYTCARCNNKRMLNYSTCFTMHFYYVLWGYIYLCMQCALFFHLPVLCFFISSATIR